MNSNIVEKPIKAAGEDAARRSGVSAPHRHGRGAERTATLHIEWTPGWVHAINIATGEKATGRAISELGSVLSGQVARSLNARRVNHQLLR